MCYISCFFYIVLYSRFHASGFMLHDFLLSLNLRGTGVGGQAYIDANVHDASCWICITCTSIP